MDKQGANVRKVLLTGAAGFIGAKVAELLLRDGVFVLGVDDLNDYYDVRLKQYRLRLLKSCPKFSFHRVSILDKKSLNRIFRRHKFDVILNLAAQAGVACSVGNPYVYLATNTLGTLHLLDFAREYKVPKFFLSSTSSVYAGHRGAFSETDAANTPYSPYAASKKAAEALCHSYYHLYGMDMIIARYFTVYGPAGRPDMAPFKFISRISQGKPITIHGDGNQTRDFTYIDDVAEGTLKALKLKGYHIINFGNDRPVKLMCFVSHIEKALGKKAVLKKIPANKADARDTRASISKAKQLLGWRPRVGLDEGIRRAVSWYRAHEKWVAGIKPSFNTSVLS